MKGVRTGDHIEIKKAFQDGYRWVPATITHVGRIGIPPAFDYRLESGVEGTIEACNETEWRYASAN